MSQVTHRSPESTAGVLQSVPGDYGLVERAGPRSLPHGSILEPEHNSSTVSTLRRRTAGRPGSSRSDLLDLLNASEDHKKQSQNPNALSPLDFDPNADEPQPFTPMFFRLTDTRPKGPVSPTRANSEMQDRLAPEGLAIPDLPAFLPEEFYDQAYYQLSTSEKLEVVRLLIRYCPVELSGGICGRRQGVSSSCKLKGVCVVSPPSSSSNIPNSND